jgi:hypothetical protein
VIFAVAGIVALAASVALALLGRAVLATPAAVDRAAASWPERVHVGADHRTLADRAAASLLATDRADAFREIVGIYSDAISFPASEGDPNGPVRIGRLIPRLRSPEERSEAQTMAGTLLAYSAGAGFGVALPGRLQASTEIVLGQARADYRAAIRSDPLDEAAKYDLELLLRQHTSQSPKRPRDRNRKRKTPAAQDRRRKTAPTNGQELHAGIYATGNGY